QHGQPAQIVVPSLAVELLVADLQSLPPATRHAEVQRLMREVARSPFDLKSLPLLRVRLLRLSDTEHIFTLVVHHIIFDGWSLSVFFRELALLYGSLRGGQVTALPELPVQYTDFAVWQHEHYKSVDGQLAWWKKQMTGHLPALELPTDRPRPAVQSY